MDCSAWLSAPGRGPATLRRLVYSAGALACIAFSTSASADRETIDDAAARMQYAYYTADIQALQAALTALSAQEAATPAPLRMYYLAYGQWRLAELLASPNGARPPDRSAAAEAGRVCAKQAQAAIDQDERFAEAHALLAACESYAPAEKPSCRKRSLQTAAALAPNNPRVRLIEALCSRELGRPEAMRAVVARFEGAALRSSSGPDWGHAEALLLLGAAALEQGDGIAARDALERALVIAPDYQQAQTLLRRASVGS